MAKLEMTGKRNLHYNRWHRKTGRKMTMIDLDSVEIDCNTKQPVAMIETKFGLIQNIDLNDFEFEALNNMATKLEVPLFCLIYYPLSVQNYMIDADDKSSILSHIQFLAIAVNERAYKILGAPVVKCTEKDWISILYKMRGISKVDALGYEPCNVWKEIGLKMPSVHLRPECY